MTPHNEAKLGDFAKTVIMPGDPGRAEYIAKNFLQDVKLINNIREMNAYTGYYKGTKISVMPSGMGMPSMGIYAYELYKYYDVENIIRVGTCGGYLKSMELLDIVLVEKTYSEGNYALTFNNENAHIADASTDINNIIKEVAKTNEVDYIKGTTICTDCMDIYMQDKQKYFSRLPKEVKPIAAEMEAFALFYTAKVFNKKAACLLNVVDIDGKEEEVTKEKRETGLDDIIKLALDSAMKI